MNRTDKKTEARVIAWSKKASLRETGKALGIPWPTVRNIVNRHLKASKRKGTA